MVVVMNHTCSDEDVAQVQKMIEEMGLRTHLSRGEEKTILGVIGIAPQDKPLLTEHMLSLPFVEDVIQVSSPYKLVHRHFHHDTTTITVGNVTIGNGRTVVMAGPCAVESREQLLETAHAVKEAGATILRGGAYKLRTSPYSFQGMREKGLELLEEASSRYGLPVITEVTETKYMPVVAQSSDIIQIGTRNMSSFDLLKDCGSVGKPVFLKRGMAATVEELLLSAEYIVSSGNPNVILCERGIRTFETSTRNTLDLAAIALIKQISHLPIFADPSHGTGRRDLVAPMARAAIAAGADGLQIEVHPNPAKALSDGPQSLDLKMFAQLLKDIGELCEFLGRPLARLATTADKT